MTEENTMTKVTEEMVLAALNAEADRPWEPLNGSVRVGDEVRQDHDGVTTTGVVGRVDKDGDPWTAEGRFIGVLEYGTWYVRRTVQELPTEDGAVILPAGEAIEAVLHGVAYTTSRATYDDVEGIWVGIWRNADDNSTYEVHPEYITLGTWKVEEK